MTTTVYILRHKKLGVISVHMHYTTAFTFAEQREGQELHWAHSDAHGNAWGSFDNPYTVEEQTVLP